MAGSKYDEGCAVCGEAFCQDPSHTEPEDRQFDFIEALDVTLDVLHEMLDAELVTDQTLLSEVIDVLDIQRNQLERIEIAKMVAHDVEVHRRQGYHVIEAVWREDEE